MIYFNPSIGFTLQDAKHHLIPDSNFALGNRPVHARQDREPCSLNESCVENFAPGTEVEDEDRYF
jgi:hypothetical protein